MKKFPKTIYVTRENEGTDDEYLNIQIDGVDDTRFDETTTVAVYELKEVGEVQVTRVFWKKGTPKEFASKR